MSVLIFLIPITLALGLLGLACFLWSLKSKQYEDLQGSAERILFEEEQNQDDKKNQKSQIKNQK